MPGLYPLDTTTNILLPSCDNQIVFGKCQIFLGDKVTPDRERMGQIKGRKVLI